MSDVPTSTPSPDPAPVTEPAPSSPPVSEPSSSPAESPSVQAPLGAGVEEVATAIVDTIDTTAADLLGRLRLAATSQQVATVKSWVKEHFGS